MGIEDLLCLIKDYSPEDKTLIIRAFECASVAHAGVYRKSGDPYITHPIAVAAILAEMKADADTIAAGLLHDTLEDSDIFSYEDLVNSFNPTIAYLVDGVTKVLNKDNKTDLEENKRKIAESILVDIRILIIKLADRLHNMRTLEYQTIEKQYKKSEETLNLYTPLARLIGEFAFKTELEDLSFKYMNNEGYKSLTNLIALEKKSSRGDLDEILVTVSQILNSNKIPYDIKLEVKSLYSLYKKLIKHETISNVHDLFEINLLVDDKDMCYEVRDLLAKSYQFIDDKSKDYILMPKMNMYSSLHESICFHNKTNVQFQIKTPEMYMINQYGLTGYWSKYKKAQYKMQDELKKLPFYQYLLELSSKKLDTKTFNQELKKNVLAEKIYINVNGLIVEVPSYYSVYLVLRKFNYDIENTYVSLNGQETDLSVELKNKDVIKIKNK